MVAASHYPPHCQKLATTVHLVSLFSVDTLVKLKPASERLEVILSAELLLVS